MELRDFLTPYPFQPTPDAAPVREAERTEGMPLANLDLIIADCSWLRHTRDQAIDLPEQEWYAQLSILGRCVDGERLAHKLSEPHPGYDRASTDAKLKQSIEASGPRTCGYIMGQFAHEGCKTCPFGVRTKHKSSPIILGTTTVKQGFVTTDSGNAERFAAYRGSEYKFFIEHGKWMRFEGKYWQLDKKDEIKVAIRDVMRSMRAEGKGDYAHLCESADKISSTERLSRPLLAVLANETNQYHHLLTCENGTIDLRTSEVLESKPEHLITMKANSEFWPGARSAVWDHYLSEATFGDKDLQRYLQKALGYSITGSTKEEKLFIAYGHPSAGKGTLTNTIQHLLGDYVQEAAPNTFIKKDRDGGIPNDLAMLVARRMVHTQEIEKGKFLASAIVKQATGRDRITARFLNNEFFTYSPEFKLWFFCNDFPKVRSSDAGMWRRIVVIPFLNHKPEDKQDLSLKDKLVTKECQMAVLAWLVEGARLWYAEGLGEPTRIMKECLAKYRSESDPISSFTEEIEVGRDYKVTITDLRSVYEEHCRERGDDPLNARFFNSLLEERGYSRGGGRFNGEYVKCWIGFKLKDSARAKARNTDQQERLP